MLTPFQDPGSGSHAAACAELAGVCAPLRRGWWLAVARSAALLPGLVALQVFAQVPAPAADPGPDATTARYGDWALQCRRNPAEGTGPACELLHTVMSDAQRPVAQVAIARPSAQAPLKLAVVLPVHVAFAEPPRVSAGAPSDAALTLAWRRCLPAGCFADADLTDGMVRVWRTQESPGRLVLQDGSGRAVALPLSFRGLGDALDALGRQ